jgi:hypothetical protein
MKRLLAIALLVVAGCAPPYGVEHSIGVVKTPLWEEAATILRREGIVVVEGETNLGMTGVRVAHEEAFRATKFLLEWRRTKTPPGAYLTRDEYILSIEGN